MNAHLHLFSKSLFRNNNAVYKIISKYFNKPKEHIYVYNQIDVLNDNTLFFIFKFQNAILIIHNDVEVYICNSLLQHYMA